MYEQSSSMYLRTAKTCVERERKKRREKKKEEGGKRVWAMVKRKK